MLHRYAEPVDSLHLSTRRLSLTFSSIALLGAVAHAELIVFLCCQRMKIGEIVT